MYHRHMHPSSISPPHRISYKKLQQVTVIVKNNLERLYGSFVEKRKNVLPLAESPSPNAQDPTAPSLIALSNLDSTGVNDGADAQDCADLLPSTSSHQKNKIQMTIHVDSIYQNNTNLQYYQNEKIT